MMQMIKQLKFKNSEASKMFPLLLFFGVVYCIISIVNHALFRTYALDLGAYTNALYDYRNFQWNDSTAFLENPTNLLADHFDLYLILWAPLSFLFGTYTLLIVQISALLLGALGIFKYLNLITQNSFLSKAGGIFFLLFFGVFSAISFDYHSNVIAACVLPWFFIAVHQDKMFKAALIGLFICIGKENMSLWLFFVALGLLWEYRSDKFKRVPLLLISAFSVLYFLSITMVVMPAFSNGQAYVHFHYSALGTDFGSAIKYLLAHPFAAFETMIGNHTNEPLGEGVKAELFLLLCLSGLPILAFRPAYLLMLLPIFFQKLFHDNFHLWGVYAQYCIEFAPLMAVGIFIAIAKIKTATPQRIITSMVLVGSLVGTIKMMDRSAIFTNKSTIRFYQSAHYFRNYDVNTVHRQLAEMPANAIVSAQSPFLPHLSLRECIYQFPTIKDAEFIVLSRLEGPYPLNEEQFRKALESITLSKSWRIFSASSGCWVFKKVN
jgi:uncharacterized membrane protein